MESSRAHSQGNLRNPGLPQLRTFSGKGELLNKVELISWLAGLSENDPRLASVESIRRDEEPHSHEEFLSLKAVGTQVDKNVSWLTRLGVQSHCGVRLAGSLRYKKSEVIAFLQSETCAARVRELHEARIERETQKQ